MTNPYDEFRDIVRELAQEEIKNFLKNEELYRSHTGIVVENLGNDKYSVDIVTSIISDIYNKSGQNLSLGDTVIVLEKYGSNFSDCFILTKTKNNTYPSYAKQSDVDSLVNRVEILENQLTNQLNGLYFSSTPGTRTIYVTTETDNYKWLIIPDSYDPK